MPTYKISRKGVQERQELVFHRRMRMVALLLSALLLLATVALLLHMRHLPV